MRHKHAPFGQQVAMFQSTRSSRSATSPSAQPTGSRKFQSALLTERDLAFMFFRLVSHFNPRTPCGARLVALFDIAFFAGVLIHTLLAECDLVPRVGLPELGISIRALLAECDLCTGKDSNPSTNFQSTHSLRSATRPRVSQSAILIFQSARSSRSARKQAVIP